MIDIYTTTKYHSIIISNGTTMESIVWTSAQVLQVHLSCSNLFSRLNRRWVWSTGRTRDKIISGLSSNLSLTRFYKPWVMWHDSCSIALAAEKGYQIYSWLSWERISRWNSKISTFLSFPDNKPDKISASNLRLPRSTGSRINSSSVVESKSLWNLYESYNMMYYS